MLKYLCLTLIIAFHPIAILIGQQYNISLLGISIVEVELDTPSPNSMVFNTKTVGIIRSIWPVENNYTTE